MERVGGRGGISAWVTRGVEARFTSYFMSPSSLPEVSCTDWIPRPQAVLDFRGKDRNKEVLIHCLGYGPADATCMQQQFPEFAIEDKGVFNGGQMLS